MNFGKNRLNFCISYTDSFHLIRYLYDKIILTRIMDLHSTIMIKQPKTDVSILLTTAALIKILSPVDRASNLASNRFLLKSK